MNILSSEEFVTENKKLHRLHVEHGYPKGKRPKISKAKRKRIFEKCNSQCVYCKKKVVMGTFDAFIDHVIPLTKGGNNEDENLVVACRRCNGTKGTRLVSEWGAHNGKD